MPDIPDAPAPARATRADALLFPLALALTGLAFCFVARNSDIWRHLATGRMIATGEYDFTSDPHSFTTDGVRWVNHAWLTEWVWYQLHRLAGGAGLIAFKAALAGWVVWVGIAGLRPDRPRWLAAVIVFAAIVAWSARATLQPFVVSCALLAAVLRCLSSGSSRLRFVPPLIALWVNMDEWFVLGPLCAVLYWADRRWRGQPAPAWLPLASVGACAVSPFHVFGFTLPTELSPVFWGSALSADPRVAPQFASYFTVRPFPGEYTTSIAFWAFCGLLAFGTTVLVAVRRTAEPWAVAVWVLVGAAAAAQARLAPLVAVVAVILIAPYAQRLTPIVSWRRFGRFAVLLLAIGSCWLAWGGRLNGPRGQDRSLGFAIIADPSLVRAAETLAVFRRDGALPPSARVLGSTPDVANVLAWFVPGERGYLDTRWELHARAGRAASADGLDAMGWGVQEPTVGPEVAVVLALDPSPRAMARAEAAGWRFVRADERVVWFAPASVLPNERFDPARAAFADTTEQTPTLERLPRYPDWWQSAGRSGARATIASAYLNRQLATKAAGAALPVLAVRAARTAIAANPDDSEAWLELARAYAVLSATVEAPFAGSGCVAELRRVQRVTAVSAAVAANPESDAARAALAATFAEFGYLDRSLDERRHQLALLRRRADPRASDVAEMVAQLEDNLFDRECLFLTRTRRMGGDPLGRARHAAALGLPQRAIDTLLASSPELFGIDGLRLLALLLLSTGQTAEAGVLLDRDEVKENPNRLGSHEVPSVLPDGRRVVFPVPAYYWFRFLHAAATGLEQPRPVLGLIARSVAVQMPAVEQLRADLTAPIAKQVIADVGLASAGLPGSRLIVARQQEPLLERLRQTRQLNAMVAEFAILNGLCAVEAGDPAAARRSFEAALAEFAKFPELARSPAKPLAEFYRAELLPFARN